LNILPTLTTVALTLGLGLMPASAQDAPAPSPRHPEAHSRMGRRLNLTEAQKTSLKAVRDKHQDGLAVRRKAAFEARAALVKAMRSPDSKPEDLKTLHRTAADLAFELRMDQRAMRLECRAILTPEQREESARMRGRMEGMMMRHRGPFRGEGMEGGAGR
jgi:Spy/CpxP family protein refolding chaperone